MESTYVSIHCSCRIAIQSHICQQTSPTQEIVNIMMETFEYENQLKQKAMNAQNYGNQHSTDVRSTAAYIAI